MQDSGSYPWSLQAHGGARHYTTNCTRKYSAGDWPKSKTSTKFCCWSKTWKAEEEMTRGEGGHLHMTFLYSNLRINPICPANTLTPSTISPTSSLTLPS